jgi:hypothetical protein
MCVIWHKLHKFGFTVALRILSCDGQDEEFFVSATYFEHQNNLRNVSEDAQLHLA